MALVHDGKQIQIFLERVFCVGTHALEDPSEAGGAKPLAPEAWACGAFEA